MSMSSCYICCSILQILMSVCWTLIHVIRSMQTALIVMVAIHVPVILASLEMEKHAVCSTYHNMITVFVIRNAL